MSGQARPQAEPVTRTWDGLEIATDHPTGSSVTVRRMHEGVLEVLLLHRAHHGPDYEGDWAWTGPAGCRQPGEPIYPAALRELHEEAGLRGPQPWAVDVSQRWAVFAVDVEPEIAVELIDPEHDRFEWVPADDIRGRVLPDLVASQQARACLVPQVSVGFRRMVEADLDSVVRWRREPHIERWWGTSPARDEVVAHYQPRLGEPDGAERVRMFVVEVDGRPVGFVQDYRVGDDDDYAVKTGRPDAVGFDYLLGEPGLVGRGIGTRVIWEFCRDVIRRDYPDATAAIASPSHRNAASLRALAKCGFEQGLWIDAPARPDEPPDAEVVCTLDLGRWFGPHAT